MMTTMVQAIAGVSPSRESEIESFFPGIGSGAIGQLIGGILGGVQNSIPVLAIRLPVLIALGAACAPLAAIAYFLRLLGSRYTLTNRSVQQRKIIGGSLVSQVALSDIDSIEIQTRSGYDFHRVGDVVLMNAQGAAQMTIEAIAFPERLRQIIIDARDARVLSDASLAHIDARG